MFNLRAFNHNMIYDLQTLNKKKQEDGMIGKIEWKCARIANAKLLNEKEGL